ncbi:phospholipase D-like domain-containing protein [Sulfoacidibacillus ferrooxidans]|uniref:Major cardiolipin synthase ClsA n=1 Tax=Sulfoacidibacillus ferrooxidans TaxID=2005001 RepID=A0A9X1VAS4_9BACL|nr:phospholipase D-like domain-containing protein [Sulfoacidibacillus ferrooxidans]MCI0182527.1 Major cardiolipin synthase ClsA [Sulfoacidibacillus ferrooxidans]
MSLTTHLEDGFFMAIGIIIILQVIVIVSSAISTRFRRRRRAVSLGRLHLPEILVKENRVQIYTYGMTLYEAMLEDIQAAKQSICIESFIWKGDRIGSAFKQAVCKKAREGVDVYVIFDSFANMVVPAEFKRFPHNVHLLQYKAWRRLWDVFDPRRLARDHRKLLVIDQQIGYVGGYNIGDLYGAKWRDTHVRIKGEAAKNLYSSFVDFWNTHASTDQHIEKETASLFPYIRLYANDATRLMFPIRSMYIEAIDLAKDRILLTTPYFIPDRYVLNSLIRAATRGVDVRLMVPLQSNHLLADWLAHTYFTECLRKGVRIFLYQGAMIHAKTATIDGTWSTVGTANLDRLSLLGNFELNIEFLNPEVAEQMDIVFVSDLQHCKELHLEEWVQRSILHKLGELVLSPLWPFL